MGRWVGRATGAVFDDVAFHDREPSAATAAAETVDGRVADEEDRFDAVCLAVPIPALADAVAGHASRAERACFDVTGVMDPAVETLREGAPDRERLSLHPLFAPDNEPGNVACVPDAPGPVTDAVREALTDRGNRVFETTPAEHDEAMTTVQARAHAAVLAYALAGDPVREEFHTPVSGALTDLAERVASGDADVYADIQRIFDGTDAVVEAARRITDADPDGFEALYRRAAERLDAGDRPDPSEESAGTTGRTEPSRGGGEES